MKRLAELSGPELAELARQRADEAKKNDERLGTVLAGLLTTVDEMTRRIERLEENG